MRFAPALLLAACGGSGRVEDILALDGDAAAGQTVWAARCASCHGSFGEGGSGPALAVPADEAAFVDVVLYGQGDMSGQEDVVDDQDVADLLAFALEGYTLGSDPCRASTSPCR
ncbi:MAG: cytochrome c [Alphaproteobacteria bacterium]|nr:cytochrome c [Alphaproteobacteria bacterium]